MWLSLVERCVRDAEVAGSNPVIPTKFIFRITTDFPRCYAEFLCFAFAQKHTFKRKKTHKKVVKQTAHFCIEKSEWSKVRYNIDEVTLCSLDKSST